LSRGRQCAKCGAAIPAGLAFSWAVPSVQEHASVELSGLAEHMEAMLAGAGDEAAFVAAFEGVRNRLELYRDSLHEESLDAISRLKAAVPDDPLPEQVEYLIVQATELGQVGVEAVETFLCDSQAADVRAGVQVLIEANNHYRTACDLLMARQSVSA
jgi:hypothetical protein